jgi:hypothetical protein
LNGDSPKEIAKELEIDVTKVRKEATKEYHKKYYVKRKEQ